MPKIHPEDGTRVLAVASHLRFPAVVALDRWGLTQLRGPGARRRDPVAFLGWDARLWGSSSERVERLIVRVRRAIVRFRPALVVLVAPVQNKVAAVLASPAVRRILGQRRSSLHLREVMDDGDGSARVRPPRPRGARGPPPAADGAPRGHCSSAGGPSRGNR